MRHRIPALAATAALAFAALGLAPAPASADEGTYINSAKIDSFSMGTQASKTFTITFNADGAEEGIDWWIESPSGCYIFETGTAEYSGTRTFKDTFTIFDSDLTNDCASTLEVHADAFGRDYIGYDSEDFLLSFKRQARIVGLNFGPEPVRKGATVTGTATLERANWNTGTYKADARAKVYSQFRTHTGKYATVRAVTSDSNGKLRSSNTQNVDGCWRFSSPGYSTTTGYSATGDCIDAR